MSFGFRQDEFPLESRNINSLIRLFFLFFFAVSHSVLYILLRTVLSRKKPA